MNALGKLIWLMVWTVLNDAASAEANCGRLEERLLFRRTLIMEPTEYPWIGLLVQRKGQTFENAKCTVAIVGESHVLTTASCVRRFQNRPELIAVRLGIWEETHEPGQQYICSDRGFCVPGPVQHLVDAITLYPLADKDTANNDIAILRLSQRINMTAYIQPLCLQPTLEPASWTSMDFHYGGFQDFDLQKGKGTAVAISWQYCTNETRITPSENQFCAFPKLRVAFYNGAPLMGINVEDDVPRSFYLVGLLVRAVDVRQVLIFFFQDIRPLRRWIMDNIDSANSQ